MSSLESQRIRATLSHESGSSPLPIEMQRRQWEEAAAQVELPPGTSIQPALIAGVPCEWIVRPDVEINRTLVFLHGGGFTTGSCRTHRELAAYLCLAAHWPVLLVDYRLAPEDPFPAGLNDAVCVYRGLLAQGFLPEHIIIGGDSAGGELALSLALQTARSK